MEWAQLLIFFIFGGVIREKCRVDVFGRARAPADVLHLWQNLLFPNIEASELIQHMLFELCQLPHALLIRGQGFEVYGLRLHKQTCSKDCARFGVGI